MLRVDRNDLAAAGAGRLSHEVTRHDQGLFVGQRNPLACLERGERGLEAGGADHGVHDDVDFRVCRRLDQHLGTRRPARVLGRAARPA